MGVIRRLIVTPAILMWEGRVGIVANLIIRLAIIFILAERNHPT